MEVFWGQGDIMVVQRSFGSFWQKFPALFDLLPQPALYCMQPKAAVQWWLVVGQQMILMREQRCKHCDFTRGADKGERTGCSDALVISNSCHGQGLEI